MDTRTLLMIAGIIGLLLFTMGVIMIVRQTRDRPDISVMAVITEIRVEASSVSNWWVIIAQWTNPSTGQALIFRSRRLRFPPKQHVGERIIVKLNRIHPQQYRMEL